MKLSHALAAVAEGDRPPSFEVFSATMDPAWIAAALQETGTVSLRRRLLPADHAVWLVIGMALFRDRPITAVAQHLGLTLPAADGSRAPITGGALVRARDRLTAAPLQRLFEMTAARWARPSAEAHRWRGLALYGVDGTTLRVADTQENEERFGRPGSARSTAGYPQLRMVALMALRSHLLAAVRIGSLAQSELTLAASLWEQLPDRSLTVLDRGFVSYALFRDLSRSGQDRHWLIRAKKDLRFTATRKLGPRDALGELAVSRSVRQKHPDLPEKLVVRAVKYRRKGFREQTLLTSLTDADAYPAAEIAALYHERWELELGFDEIKTHALERQEALRSRDPDRVLQEVYGLVVAYNLVRRRMEIAADAAGVPPVRMGFRGALLLTRDLWRGAWFLAPGTLAQHIRRLDAELVQLVLPPRRARKSYPRAVKLKQSAYDRKR